MLDHPEGPPGQERERERRAEDLAAPLALRSVQDDQLVCRVCLRRQSGGMLPGYPWVSGSVHVTRMGGGIASWASCVIHRLRDV